MPLTRDDFDATASVFITSVEQCVRYGLDDEVTPIRIKDYSRVYRLLCRVAGGSPPTIRFEDAAFPEHHNESGMLGRRRTRPDLDADEVETFDQACARLDHTCSLLCRDSVRLIYVGHEDLLDRLMVWWDMRNRVLHRRCDTVVVEQDANVAQEQVRADGWYPLFLLDEVQQVVADGMVKETETRTSRGVQTTWSLI